MLMKKTLLFLLISMLSGNMLLTASDVLTLGNADFETAWTGLTDYGSPNVILKKVTTIASDVTNWTGDVGNGNLSIYQGPGYTGNNSAVLINTHASGGARFYSNSVLKLTKGRQYRLTFFARGAATIVNVCLYQSGVRPTIAQVAGPNTDGVYDATKTVNTSVSYGITWTKMEYNFTVPVNSAYTDYKLYFALYGCTAPAVNGSNLNSAFMIDDVKFELLENSDFEKPWTGLTDYGSPDVILKKVTTISSDVPGWTGDVGNGNLTIYQGPGYSGNNSAVLINTHATGGARFYNNSVLKLKKGGKYRLTFYARGTATLVNVSLFQSGVRPSIAQVAGPNAGGVYDPDKTVNSQVILGSTWTKMEYNFTVPASSAYTDYKLYFALYGCTTPALNGSNLSSAFMIDDVQIESYVVPNAQDSVLAATAEITDIMLDSAIIFRSSLKGEQGYRSGVYVYDSKSISTYINNPEKLAARIALLGIKDVYVSATVAALNGSNATRYQWLKDFNAVAHQYGLTTWAVRLANYDHFVSDALILQDCSRVLAYNNSVSANERFDAVSADWEPHVLKQGGADTPEELNIFWDSVNNYGIGEENDSLLHRTHNMLSLAKNNLDGLMLNEAIHYMYQDRYDLGQLSYGSTVQFLNDCDYVTVMCYTNTKENVWQRADAPIANASNHPKTVSVCVKTSMNTYGDGGDASTSLYPKGWGYLISAMNYIYSQGAQEPAFRGVDFFEFEGLEMMWTNINPPQSTRTAIENSVMADLCPSIIYDSQTESLMLTNLTKNYRVDLYSLQGKLISQKMTNHAIGISVSHLPKGCYIVRLSCDSELPVTYHFIK